MGETRIREALELLRERGWVQRHYSTPDGGRCMVGALSQVWVPDGGFVASESIEGDWQTLLNVIKEQTGHREIVSPSTANDWDTTTFADIEVWMEKAAIMREEAVE